ncbi:MAG: hypothetical protein VX820_02140 [Candidatus Neomarinimicrobiota bacterium]|nr:hypothetical protein [Candidatus Neomarinimicrobiota bacterium]
MKRLLFILFLLIIACSEKDDNSPSTNLAVNLIVNDNIISMGEDLALKIQVMNADSLFALSFELNYSSDLFEANSPSAFSGNLFSDGFKYELLSTGELGVALGVGEDGIIHSTSSGIACEIILSSIGLGNDIIFLSSLHMIKSNGEEIDGFDELIVEPITINIVND